MFTSPLLIQYLFTYSFSLAIENLWTVNFLPDIRNKSPTRAPAAVRTLQALSFLTIHFHSLCYHTHTHTLLLDSHYSPSVKHHFFLIHSPSLTHALSSSQTRHPPLTHTSFAFHSLTAHCHRYFL